MRDLFSWWFTLGMVVCLIVMGLGIWGMIHFGSEFVDLMNGRL